MRILVVDDEMDLCEILRFNFESEGFEVDTANSAEEALQMLSSQHSLILLDVMMDRMSGYEMAQHLRDKGNQIPIIFLTAKTDEQNQLQGFSCGADDYITKPFSFATVLARVKAVLKRSGQEGAPFSLDEAKQVVIIDGLMIELTRKEFKILQLLTSQQGTYFSREQILNEVWDDDTCVNDRSVDVHIARLRKKLGPLGNNIQNKVGLGYMFQL